ncbi:MAG: hypothetical protein JETT_1928 [Candidatus Jettenia ecosi]|uniref:Uncharacterized protein n=1 Tax=Candidatus Jettenia ecosi TaxID=2494326 RepID=A0A533QAV3_9BACT|nr:MAG: hypothetical protein JETT_1928 [Candidatus Jettenia ecosi]
MNSFRPAIKDMGIEYRLLHRYGSGVLGQFEYHSYLSIDEL